MKNTDPNLIVRFAKDQQDLLSAQRLRYRVFVDELGATPRGADHAQMLELEDYDQFSAHLCLIDIKREKIDPENAVVGVYRLIDENASTQMGGFYSSKAFDLSTISKLNGKKLELGRSCIDPAYRGGAAMAMLWSVLGSFIEQNEIAYLLGSASFHGTGIIGKRMALSNLYYHHLAPLEMRATAFPENALDMRLTPKDGIIKLKAMKETPSLIKAYLRLGGVIGEGANIDHNFNTIDVFVLMRTREMVKKYQMMYKR